MGRLVEIHPQNPQNQLIKQAAEILQKGGVVAYPTDSAYAIGCALGEKKAFDTIKNIRQLDDKHFFTLMCNDLSSISTYAKLDNSTFRLLKTYTPGAYTFILSATSEVPRLMMHPKRRAIGIRIPNHNIALALIKELGSPLMSVTFIPPNSSQALTNADDIYDTYGHCIDLVIDGGACDLQPTSVLDLRDDKFQILREGKGDISTFL